MNRSDEFRPRSLAEWHPGEVALQTTFGSLERLAPHAGDILQPRLSEQIRDFFPRLPFVVLGFVDEALRPWGTMLPGKPGFAWSPDPALLQIDHLPPAGDLFDAALKTGASIGVLGIELSTRRRNRVNGVIASCGATGFSIEVQQAYGNCPQYIQQRLHTESSSLQSQVISEPFTGLDDAAARDLIGKTDTLFVSTFAPGPDGRPAMDMSHRGGRPGFVKVASDGCLTIPDFSGNKFFNTLGNILLTGRAGLVIPSFETGDLLVLTGDASIELDEEGYAEAAQFPGAERLWRVRPSKGFWLRGALPIEFQFRAWSQNTLGTGVWPE